jgi:arabinan endo-1,5-alpha-L-arabinosidase
MYQNPLSPLNFPDPAAIKFRGRYYAYATGESVDGRIFPIMTSADAIHWSFHAGAMAPLPDPQANEYWAPEVAYHNGLFYLYYAVIAFGTPEHHLRVAVSDSPLGPFEDQGLNLTPNEIFAIDAHPFQDDDGQWYLFFARDYLEPPYIGTGNAVDRLVGMTKLSGRPARVLRPYAEWQLFERQRAEKGGVDWYTVEGPWVLKRRGKYTCLYSGGCWKERDYGVAYAVSDVPMGPSGYEDRSYRDDDNRDGPTLLRTQPGLVLGPGHNSVVKAPNNVADLMVYHGWPPELTGRLLRVDRMEWHAGKPYCAGPTLTPQPLPPVPAFGSGSHDQPDAYDWMQWSLGPAGWVENWRLENGELIVPTGARLVSFAPRENYLFEANLRFLGDPATGGAGVIAAAIDDKERLVVTIEREEITLRPQIGSALRAPLPPGFRHEVYHQLLIERNAGRIRVRLDDLVVLEGDFAPGPAQVGIQSEVPAAFDGITLTEHFSDDFRSGEARGWWAGQHSHWDVRDGALVQPEANPGRHEIAKGEALFAWELDVDVQPLSRGGACGVIARFANEGLAVEAALEGAGRDDGRGSSWLCRLGSELRPLPPTFDSTAEHHLRLEKDWEMHLSLWLDGTHVATIDVPAEPSRFSLFTQDAAAAFRDVSFTGLGPHPARE